MYSRMTHDNAHSPLYGHVDLTKELQCILPLVCHENIHGTYRIEYYISQYSTVRAIAFPLELVY